MIPAVLYFAFQTFYVSKSAELIDHIDVYHAEKQDGVTTQHITIYYNCIGAFSVPDRRKIPAAEITMGTRKGVAISYSRSRIAV